MTTREGETGVRRTAALVAIGYWLLGTAWMVGAGLLDIFRYGVHSQIWTADLARGLLFVAVSTVALFAGAVHLLRTRGQTEAKLKQTTSELAQAQKLEAVGRLAASVAHDFNNVLTAVTGMAELLRDDLAHGSEVQSQANEIVTTASRATGLTRQLLIFSGSSEPHRAGVDINDSIVALMPMLRAMLGTTIELEVDMSADEPCVFMDPSRVDQVIMNLVSNARDALPEGGKVVVESRVAQVGGGGKDDVPDLRAGEYAILIVSDTGSGMDAETLSRCFEPFFTTKPKGRGTGLGLATVYGIIREAGGYLSVYSELGTGTTFKAYVPLLRDEPVSRKERMTKEVISRTPATASPRINAKPETPARPAATVLIVEDEPGVRKVAASAIGRAGYRVVTASNAGEAVKIAQDCRVDLLFTDMVLPDRSGGELARELLESNPDMRVLITSGYTELSVRLRPAGMILSEGRAHFIEKPYSVADLAARVDDVLHAPSGPGATAERAG
jgi:signal transduction histidine kinase/ActR/RegA family two-component response regulator